MAHSAFYDSVSMRSQYISRSCVIEVKENWMTEARSNCSDIKQDLRRAKTYCCSKCPSKFDRDFNAAKKCRAQVPNPAFIGNFSTCSPLRWDLALVIA